MSRGTLGGDQAVVAVEVVSVGIFHDAGDFAAVIKFLKEKKLDTDTVSIDGGDTEVSIKELFENRAGKVLDVSAAAAQAANGAGDH